LGTDIYHISFHPGINIRGHGKLLNKTYYTLLLDREMLGGHCTNYCRSKRYKLTYC